MMRVFTIPRSALLPALLFCCCFGPFDPSDPPPERIDNGEPDTSTTPATSLPAGLVAWWTCDDTSGSVTLKDSLGKSHGQLTGCSRDSGISGLALRLNGNGDFVSIQTNDSLFDFGTGDFTVSLWVKPLIVAAITDTTRYDIISKGVVYEQGYTLSISCNSFRPFVGLYSTTSASIIDTSFPANAGSWRHLVMLRRKGIVELYVNKNKVLSYNSSSNVSSDLHLLIGRDASSRLDHFYSGLIDEIKILSKAWVLSDIAKEYQRFR